MPKRRIVTACSVLLMAALLIFSVMRSHGNIAGNFALAGFLFAVVALVPFYTSFESRRPTARELLPVAVLAAVAALGRVIFAPFPFVKPTSAVVIVAGLAFGPEAGFMTGATAALTSNIFFGQGPYTPWQMFSWGMMGFCAGIPAVTRLLKRTPAVLLYGFVWGFLFGWIMDAYQVLSYLETFTWEGAFLTFAASFPFDLTHALSNVVFLLCIAKPWRKILERVKRKYGLMRGAGND